MTTFGWRPLQADVHEAFMDSLGPALQQKWKTTVLPTKPGILSSFGTLNHLKPFGGADTFVEKAESDVRDIVDGCPAYSLGLLRTFAKAALTGQLRDL